MSEQTPAVVPTNGNPIGVFESLDNFIAAQRMANVLAASTMVPKEYQGNVANCVIALELASRLRASPFMVMQNLDVIHGRPSLRATFIIGTVNTCGRYTPLAFDWCGKEGEDSWGCRGVAVDKATGQVLEGTWITWGMAKREGWTTKSGSKWQTMPEQMFRYRAAAFWARAYAPETMLGMSTSEEVREIVVEAEEVAPRPAGQAPKAITTTEVTGGMAGLAAALEIPAKAEPEPARKPAPKASKGFESPAPMTAEEMAAAHARERAEAAG